LKPRIELLPEKKFIGKRLQMSFTENKTFELWRSFMPKKKQIQNILGMELYSIEIYPHGYFDNFDPKTGFEKWAAVEVADVSLKPDAMETLTIPSGTYAVFVYKGLAGKAPETYQYIFGTWLPDSEFFLDNRPHFALMGEKYKNDSPDSEEEFWIPVKEKLL
jgi:AraC family transcriptional regulator